MSGSLSRIEKVEIFAALGLGVISLMVALWSAVTTNAYSELTSKPHVKVYQIRLRAQDFGRDSTMDRSSRITCDGSFRFVNIGGAGAILEQVEVTVEIEDQATTQGVSTISDATDAAGDGYGAFVDDYLYTAYMEDRAFPVVIEPYGVYDLPTVLAELEHPDRQFALDLYVYNGETDQLLPPIEGRAVAVSLSYEFGFADGSVVSVPSKICTYVVHD